MPSNAPEPTGAPIIIISYSKEDEKWKDRLVSFFPAGAIRVALNPLETTPRLEGELSRFLSPAKVLVLLLSANYLSRSWVATEQANLVSELESINGLKVVPVLLRPCSWQEIPLLRERQVVTSDGKPIEEDSSEGQITTLQSLASRIVQLSSVHQRPYGDLLARELEKFKWSEEVGRVIGRAASLAISIDEERPTVTATCLLFALAEVGREPRRSLSANLSASNLLWLELTRRGVDQYEKALRILFPRLGGIGKGSLSDTLLFGRLTASTLRVFELGQEFSVRTIKLEPPPGTDIAPPLSDGRIHTRHLLAALLRIWHEEPWPIGMDVLKSNINPQLLSERLFDFIVESLPDDHHDEWQEILGVERKTKVSKTAKATKASRKRDARATESIASGALDVESVSSVPIIETSEVGRHGGNLESLGLESPALPNSPLTPPMSDLDFASASSAVVDTPTDAPIETPKPEQQTQRQATLDLSLEDKIVLRDEDDGEADEEPDLRPILAGFATDYWDGRDLLDTTQDVNALASLVSAWSVEPPLSIGLFGDWGSGKSHFMRQMRKRVEKLSRKARNATDRKQKDIGYYKNIVQIEFNAWHYIEGNLWASLVDHIFANLKVAEKENLKAAEARRDQLMEKLGVKKEIESKLQSKIEERKTELDTKKREAIDRANEADIKREDASKALAGFRHQAETALNELQLPINFSKADQELLQRFGIKPSELSTPGDVRHQYHEVKGFWNRAKVQWRLFRTDPRVKRRWFFAALLVLIPFLGILLGKLPQVKALPAALVSALTFLAAFFAAAKPTWEQFQKGLKALEEQDEAIERERQKRMAELQGEVSALTKTVIDAQNEAETIRTEIANLENQIKSTTTSKILAEFIEDRAAAADYRRHLGLLALIRRDFEKLRELFDQQRNEEKEGKESDDVNRINRIILYIDDLDRCPPQRVVEVLQAIHLLLAFPIFVVVVGVDARWVTRSLQESYEWLRLEDDDSKKEDVDGDDDLKRVQGATPHDYLEKIFQIPFWLRPMEETQTQTFIEGLTEQIRYRPPTEKPEAIDDGSNGKKLTGESTRMNVVAETIRQETIADGNGHPVQTIDNSPVVISTPKISEDGSGKVISDAAAEQTVSQEAVDAASDTIVETTQPPEAIQPGVAEHETIDKSDVVGDFRREAEEEDDDDVEEIDLAPHSLTLGDQEIAYMKSLAELIGRSPRAVKRFLNCYRLIKVGLTPEQLSNFVQDGASYEFKAVMTLLGIITGAPTASLFVMEELEHWTWSEKKGRPSMTDFYDQLEKNEDLLRQPDWSRLKPFLTGFEETKASADFFAAFKKNTPRVSRYSFRIARAEAAGPKRAAAPTKSPPVPKAGMSR